jgi:hypothetical protein
VAEARRAVQERANRHVQGLFGAPVSASWRRLWLREYERLKAQDEEARATMYALGKQRTDAGAEKLLDAFLATLPVQSVTDGLRAFLRLSPVARELVLMRRSGIERTLTELKLDRRHGPLSDTTASIPFVIARFELLAADVGPVGWRLPDDAPGERRYQTALATDLDLACVHALLWPDEVKINVGDCPAGVSAATLLDRHRSRVSDARRKLGELMTMEPLDREAARALRAASSTFVRPEP